MPTVEDLRARALRGSTKAIEKLARKARKAAAVRKARATERGVIARMRRIGASLGHVRRDQER